MPWPGCLDYYCNKITLQPIIENAVLYGLDLMVDEGRIQVRVSQEGEDIVFHVRDNGVSSEHVSAYIGTGNYAAGKMATQAGPRPTPSPCCWTTRRSMLRSPLTSLPAWG